MICVHILCDLDAPTVIPASINLYRTSLCHFSIFFVDKNLIFCSASSTAQNEETDAVLVIGQTLLAFAHQTHNLLTQFGAEALRFVLLSLLFFFFVRHRIYTSHVLHSKSFVDFDTIMGITMLASSLWLSCCWSRSFTKVTSSVVGF
jgi:hypothetical protein